MHINHELIIITKDFTPTAVIQSYPPSSSTFEKKWLHKRGKVTSGCTQNGHKEPMLMSAITQKLKGKAQRQASLLQTEL